MRLYFTDYYSWTSISQKVYTLHAKKICKSTHKSIYIFLLSHYHLTCFLYYCKVRKIGYIQELLGKRILLYRYARKQREKKIQTLTQAKRIGVVYDATLKENHTVVVETIDTLKKEHNISVDALGFIANKELLSSLEGRSKLYYFSKQDFTWYGTTKTKEIKNFVDTEFDILLILTSYWSFPFTYVLGHSKSPFTVGVYSEEPISPDLMLSVKKDSGIAYIISQILIYLSMIQVSK